MKFTDCSVIVLVVSCLSYVVTGQLICLSCRGAPTPSECGVVEKCGSHSQCYLDMVVEDAGAIYFNSGCRDIQRCAGSGRRREAGRNVTSLPTSTMKTVLPAMFPHLNTSITGISKTGGHLDKTEKHKRGIACSTCCNYRNFCNDNGCGQKGLPATRGPICYACDQQRSIDDCREIKVCGRDEICYITEITLASDKIFHTSCISKRKCIDQNIIMTKSTVSLVGRTIERDRVHHDTNNAVDERLDNRDQTRIADIYDERERRSTSAQGCCSGDLCNTILPRNGNWGPWTAWGTCSSSCGFQGSRQRFRKCEYPPASHGGLPCIGSSTETDITCANKSCDKQMICLSCTASVHPRTCNYIETCGPNSVCYVEEYVSHAGEIRFKTGCRDKLRCHNGIHRAKRFMVNGDYLSCMECCQGNLCNSRGCGEPGYPSSRGPICYNCDQQKDPAHCGKIDICKDGQKCGLIQHQFIDTVYQTKCLDPQSCKSDDINNPDYPKCCSTSLCAFQSGITPKPNDGSSPTSTTKSGYNRFTTSPTTKPTAHHGFTTAPTTKPTVQTESATAPTTKPTAHHRFTTAQTTKQRVTPTSQIVGQWTQWTPWSSCLETDPNVQGTKERMRECIDPDLKHQDVCIHSNIYKDIVYCRGGQTDVCTPPQITDIKITAGTWELDGHVVVQCFVKGNPTPDVRWQRHTDDVQIFPGDSSKIVIGPIKNRHEGNYICEAFNKCNESVMKTFITPALPTTK